MARDISKSPLNPRRLEWKIPDHEDLVVEDTNSTPDYLPAVKDRDLSQPWQIEEVLGFNRPVMVLAGDLECSDLANDQVLQIIESFSTIYGDTVLGRHMAITAELLERYQDPDINELVQGLGFIIKEGNLYFMPKAIALIAMTSEEIDLSGTIGGPYFTSEFIAEYVYNIANGIEFEGETTISTYSPVEGDLREIDYSTWIRKSILAQDLDIEYDD
jgi:hypothetical protein